MRRALLALAVLLAAGCLQPGPEGGGAGEGDAQDASWAARALTDDEGHDHADPAQHEGFTTPNFEILGYDPLLSPDYAGSTPGGYLCGDAKEMPDGRRIAVVESRSDVGFALADVTDPAAPEWLGELVMRRTHIYDVAVVPDGKHVLAITSGFDDPQQDRLPVPGAAAAPAMEWRSACGGPAVAVEDPIPRPPGVLLVSIEDPARPAIVDHYPVTGFGHSLESAILSGRTLVIASTVASGGTDSFDLLEIASTPLGARFRPLAKIVPDDPPARDLGGHSEGWLAVHPVLQKDVLYLQSRSIIRVMDLTDPTMPKELGRWSDVKPGREGWTGPLHSIYPFSALRDGKHYLAIGPEWVAKPEGAPTGIVFIVDATDPADMREVAWWTLPHDVAWTDRLMWSTHYLTVVGETMFVSMYHGGVWAVDVSDLGDGSAPVALRSVGVFIPNRVSPAPPQIPVRWAPTQEEVLAMPDGTLVTFDSNSGLYTFRYDETRPMPAPAPWPLVGI